MSREGQDCPTGTVFSVGGARSGGLFLLCPALCRVTVFAFQTRASPSTNPSAASMECEESAHPAIATHLPTHQRRFIYPPTKVNQERAILFQQPKLRAWYRCCNVPIEITQYVLKTKGTGQDSKSTESENFVSRASCNSSSKLTNSSHGAVECC